MGACGKALNPLPMVSLIKEPLGRTAVSNSILALIAIGYGECFVMIAVGCSAAILILASES
jgi:hypothetical protein